MDRKNRFPKVERKSTKSTRDSEAWLTRQDKEETYTSFLENALSSKGLGMAFESVFVQWSTFRDSANPVPNPYSTTL